MDERRRMFAKSVIMKGLESDYSSYESETEELNYPIPRGPSIHFEDYTSEDDVHFMGIKNQHSPIHKVLTNWDQLYP